MQLKSPLGKVVTEKKVEALERADIRIGAYYSKLKTNQKKRFDHIVRAITYKFKIYPRKSPLETILVRQIALNTVRIEEAELAWIDEDKDRYDSPINKWLFDAQKERRQTIESLSTIMKREGKKGGMEGFGKLRNILRDEQDLPKSETEVTPTGHDRRHYDDVTRTAK